MIKFISRLTLKVYQDNPEYIFVFGDNLIGRGKAGQAIIRDEPNAIGIPTKRLPSMKNGSFFNDEQAEYDVVLKQLKYLWRLHKDGKCIVLPNNQIGGGLAKTASKSPIIWSLITKFYNSAKEASNE